MKTLINSVLTFVGLLPATGFAVPIPLDLGDFFSLDPEVVVMDASTATMTDSEYVSVVTLTNDPWLGDPEIIVAGVGRSLTFDLEFVQPAGNIDEFAAYLFDSDLGSFAGVVDSVLFDSSYTGPVSFDLSSWVGVTLGLQFELYDPGFDLGSTVMISNLALNDPMPAPAPPAVALFLFGLTMLVAMRRGLVELKNRTQIAKEIDHSG